MEMVTWPTATPSRDQWLNAHGDKELEERVAWFVDPIEEHYTYICTSIAWAIL